MCPLTKTSLSVRSRHCSEPQPAPDLDPTHPTPAPWRGSLGRTPGIPGRRNQATWCNESGRALSSPRSVRGDKQWGLISRYRAIRFICSEPLGADVYQFWSRSLVTWVVLTAELSKHFNTCSKPALLFTTQTWSFKQFFFFYCGYSSCSVCSSFAFLPTYLRRTLNMWEDETQTLFINFSVGTENNTLRWCSKKLWWLFKYFTSAFLPFTFHPPSPHSPLPTPLPNCSK